VTGVTLSREQGSYARHRVRDLGLADRAEIRIQDYRDTGGRYDAIASVEMGEHVGQANYPAFCAAQYGLLRPGGRLLIQQMSRGGRAPGGGAFIESYIAPRHAHAPGRGDNPADRAGRIRGHRGPGHARALRPHHPGLARQPAAEPARDLRSPHQGAGPRLEDIRCD
jgi:hypothetical protein